MALVLLVASALPFVPQHVTSGPSRVGAGKLADRLRGRLWRR